jgi:hypothetical protein
MHPMIEGVANAGIYDVGDEIENVRFYGNQKSPSCQNPSNRYNGYMWSGCPVPVIIWSII